MKVKKPSQRFTPEIQRQIEGRNPVLEALKAGTQINKILIEEGVGRDERISLILSLARKKDLKIIKTRRKTINKLSKTGGQHQGIIAYAQIAEELSFNQIIADLWQKKELPLFIILSNVVYEHNLGAVLRSAEAAGVHAVIVPKRSFGLTPVVCKTAVGAEEYIPLIHENIFNVLKICKKTGIKIIAASEKAHINLYKSNLNRGIAIVMGAEDEGIGLSIEKYVDEFIAIPMKGKIESLNMSVSASLFIFETLRQREENKTYVG